MSSEQPAKVRDILLARRGVVFVASAGKPTADQVRAVELELAGIGYVLSARLRARLALTSIDELAGFRAWALATLLAHAGGDQKHEPLFRKFPKGVPSDTEELYWTKVLVHFLQAEDQPCLTCMQRGTTHVLDPCKHVVCDRCFDGASYSACPICEHHVDRTSPFFRASPPRGVPTETVRFKFLDLGTSERDEARALFTALCARTQALSPTDRDALAIVLADVRGEVLGWLPPAIPVRENVAVVFGTLFKLCPPADVLPHAQRFMKTATDVLRFIAVLSGTDGSLLPETVFKPVTINKITRPLPRSVRRFKVAKLSRALRRTLFAILEGFDPDRLAEDMLRHQSYWVWVGEFLHPHEYAARFPNVSRAFQIVREYAPDGTPAPPFRTWNARLADTIARLDADAMLAVLAERPGELARRFDHVLRIAPDDAARWRIVTTFTSMISSFATPVLVTLRSHLPTRDKKAGIRVYWPKGRVAKGVSSPDERIALPRATIESAVRAIEAELLGRFATKPAFTTAVIDEALRTVIVPFNERTASRAAVALPRGSRVDVPAGKLTRLFLHWCEPEGEGRTTDLDLSIGFYDHAWHYVGVCSYYQLEARTSDGTVLARSAGDLRSAPWPDGATEFVDLRRDPALAAGIRYAVMVVNNYYGLPFSKLARAFAGLMLRDDAEGHHFDPRTVELKFALEGENGVFLPVVFDLQASTLHWLDVHSKGQFQMTNVASSNAAIKKICPELMMYFGSGVRCSMYELGLLHAAARCERVFVRGATIAEYVRQPGETITAFHARLVRGDADEPRTRLRLDPPVLALLYRGDLELPDNSSAYALFRETVTPSLAASDLLA